MRVHPTNIKLNTPNKATTNNATNTTNITNKTIPITIYELVDLF